MDGQLYVIVRSLSARGGGSERDFLQGLGESVGVCDKKTAEGEAGDKGA